MDGALVLVTSGTEALARFTGVFQPDDSQKTSVGGLPSEGNRRTSPPPDDGGRAHGTRGDERGRSLAWLLEHILAPPVGSIDLSGLFAGPQAVR